MKRWLIVAGLALSAGAAQAQAPIRSSGDSVSAQFVDADLRSVIQALSRFLPRPVLIASVPATKVSLETPVPVPRQNVIALLRGMLDANGLELAEDSAFYRVREKPAPPPPVRPAAPPPPSQASQASGAAELYVIRLRHARAADVAATVGQLFGAGGNFSSASGLSTGTLSDELRRSNVPPAGPGAGQGSNDRQPAHAASLSGAVTIVPDEITNSLMIRASRADYDVIHAAIDELDIRPLQVLIEVLIVEARRDNSFSLSTNLLMPDQRVAGRTRGSASIAGGGIGDLVVQLLNVTHANLEATIGAAESRGNVTIVSRPVVIASNNVEARLLVGSQRPFVQVSRSLPTDQPQRDQVVEYKDVGTRLTVKPTINYDGYVSLEIQQEVDEATDETEFDAPVISTREAATRVLVRNGQTVVLGGLRDVQHSNNSGGIPLLSRIPLIGGLFGNTAQRLTSTELYLFITPRILTTDADADSVTAPRLRQGGQP